MQSTQTLSIQGELVNYPETLPRSSDGGSRTSAKPIGPIMNDESHNKSMKWWSSLFQPSKPACTYWDQFSHAQKFDAIGPELSKPSVVGSGKAWSPKGDVLKKWNDELLLRIQKIVDAELSRGFIYQGVKKRSLCTCDLWMVSDGPTRETAHPTIVAICADRKIAKKTLYVLKHNPQLQDLRLGFKFLEWEENIALTAGRVDELMGNGPPETEALRLCGSRVVASSIPISARSPWVQTTIGGVLLLNGVYYGLSVAHPFYRDEDDQNGSSPGSNETDRLLKEDGLSDDEKDWDRIFDELSRALASGSAEDTSAYKPSTREPIATTVFLARDLANFEANVSGSSPPAGNSAQGFLENLSLVGYLPKPRLNPVGQADSNDSQWVSFTLDWALIRLHDPRFWGRNWFKSVSGKSILTSFVAYTPPNGQVIIATRHNGPRTTHSWGPKGECGAWVIDPESGCLYGVVIASSQGLDVTYVLPAHRILADINERFGGELGGPEDMFPKGEMEPWSWDMDEDIIGQRFQLYEDQQSIASTAPSTSAPASVFDQLQKKSLRLLPKNKSLITGTLYSDDGSSERPPYSSINPLKAPENTSLTTKALEVGPGDGNSREGIKAQTPEPKPQNSGTLSSQRETPASEQRARLTEEVAAVRNPAKDSKDRKHNVTPTDPGRLHRASPGPTTMSSDIAQATQKQTYMQCKAAELVEQPTLITPIPSTQLATERPSQTEAKQAAESSVSSPTQAIKKLPNTAVAEQTSALTRPLTKLAPEGKDSREYNADTLSPTWRLHAGSNRKYYVFMKGGQIGYEFEDGRRLTQREFDQLPCAISDSAGAALYPSSEQGSHPRDTSFGAPTDATLYTGVGDSRQPSGQTTGLVMEKSPLFGLSRLSRGFVGIPMGSYTFLHSFLVDHPEILSYTEIDSLIAEARGQERIGNGGYSQTLVHHALLLRRCREMDPKDYPHFFKQLGDTRSDMRHNFINGVKEVYATIQAQVRTELQQPQVPNTQDHGGRVPLVDQGSARLDRHTSHQPLLERRRSGPTQPKVRSRYEVASEDQTILDQSTGGRKVQDNDGGRGYQDENEPFLQPSRSAVRRRGDTDTAERGSQVTGLNTEVHTRDYRAQGAKTAAPRDPGCAAENTDPPQRGQFLNRPTSVSSLGQMPTLLEDKPAQGRVFKGTDGDAEALDPRYQKRPDAKNFFTRGRVFSLLWHEPSSQSDTLSIPAKVTRGRSGELIFSHILRMVVVKEGNGACLCLPINTYGGRGVSKPGFSKADREAHAIVHMSDTKPQMLSDERDIVKTPIAIDKASPEQKLDTMSRINFSRVHTVTWNVKVMNVGRVARESMPRLVTYWKHNFE